MCLENHPYCFRLGGSSRNIQKMIDERIPFHVSLKNIPKRIPFFIYDSFPMPENTRGVVVQPVACHLGGYRYDFVFPICRGKYRKMYLAPRIKFICRKCHRLSYRSKSLNKKDRLYYRKNKIYRQYGIPPSTDRPSGMHRKTFGGEYIEELKILHLHNQAYPQHAESGIKSAV